MSREAKAIKAHKTAPDVLLAQLSIWIDADLSERLTKYAKEKAVHQRVVVSAAIRAFIGEHVSVEVGDLDPIDGTRNVEIPAGD